MFEGSPGVHRDLITNRRLEFTGICIFEQQNQAGTSEVISQSAGSGGTLSAEQTTVDGNFNIIS